MALKWIFDIDRVRITKVFFDQSEVLVLIRGYILEKEEMEEDVG